MTTKKRRFEVRLAESEADVRAAQRLRYRVFVEEMGAKVSEEEHAQQLEIDKFDPYFEHLLLIDKHALRDGREHVVGVYRLMPGSVAKAGIGFYSASEYDLTKLENLKSETLELGRSCIAKQHRGGFGVHQLWAGLGDYVARRDIGVLFGVASFHCDDPAEITEALSHLHHNHLAPENLRVRVRPDHYTEMNLMPAAEIDTERALAQIPSLIKAYLRLGGFVGEGAFIDKNFKTIDVCLLMDTNNMVNKYRALYRREKS